MDDLDQLKTEASHWRTRDLDCMDAIEIVRAIAESNIEAIALVHAESASIAKAIDVVAQRLMRDGRLFYVGAGTSGRLGVLDAAECPPTFGVSDQLVQGVIAGGMQAIVAPLEDAEDDESKGEHDLRDRHLNDRDVVIAISASGRTPYCLGALQYAKSLGTAAIALSCNPNAVMSRFADVVIEITTGPEVLTGSTRLKAGTAQKVVLNMISTAVMARLGKVYKNYMVDMIASNEKLRKRARRIVMAAAALESEEHAGKLLEQTNGDIKASIVMATAGINREEAVQSLQANGGFVRSALREHVRHDQSVTP